MRAARILGVPLEPRRARREIAGRARGTPAHRQPAAEAGPGLRGGARRRDGRRRRPPAGRSTSSRSTSSGSTRWTGRCCARSASPSRASRSGSSTLAVAVSEEPDTVEEVYEPFLLKQGLLHAHAAGPGGHRRRPSPTSGWRRRRHRTPDGTRRRDPGCSTRRRAARSPDPVGHSPGDSPPSVPPLESLPLHGPCIFLVYLALLAVAFFILIVRPQRRQMAARRALIASLEVGDEVITAGGIYGTILEIDGHDLRVEVAPGIVLTLAREAVSAPPGPPTDAGPTRARRRPDRSRPTRRPRATGRGRLMRRNFWYLTSRSC